MQSTSSEHLGSSFDEADDIILIRKSSIHINIVVVVVVVVIEFNVRFPHLSDCLMLYLTLRRIWNQWCLKDIGVTYWAFNAHKKCRCNCHSKLYEFSCCCPLLIVDPSLKAEAGHKHTFVFACVCAFLFWGDRSIFHPFQPAH